MPARNARASGHSEGPLWGDLSLRRAVSDLTLDKLILQEAARGNY